MEEEGDPATSMRGGYCPRNQNRRHMSTNEAPPAIRPREVREPFGLSRAARGEQIEPSGTSTPHCPSHSSPTDRFDAVSLRPRAGEKQGG